MFPYQYLTENENYFLKEMPNEHCVRFNPTGYSWAGGGGRKWILGVRNQ
jgi:hypothetical protein